MLRTAANKDKGASGACRRPRVGLKEVEGADTGCIVGVILRRKCLTEKDKHFIEVRWLGRISLWAILGADLGA